MTIWWSPLIGTPSDPQRVYAGTDRGANLQQPRSWRLVGAFADNLAHYRCGGTDRRVGLDRIDLALWLRRALDDDGHFDDPRYCWESAHRLLVPDDATIEIFDLQGIPPFHQDDEQHPPATVAALKTRIRAADAVLFVTPEYNYSIPGCSRMPSMGIAPLRRHAWEGKPRRDGRSVGTLGTARAQSHSGKSLSF